MVSTRSMSKRNHAEPLDRRRKKFKCPLMPLDLPGPACASEARRKSLKKEQKAVYDRIKRRPKGKKPIKIDFSKVTIYHPTIPKHTDQSRLESLGRLGVTFLDGFPKGLKFTPKQKKEYEMAESLVKVMDVLIKNNMLPQRDVITLLYVFRRLHNFLVGNFSIWKLLDLHGMKNAGDRLVDAFTLKRYYNVEHINLECAQGMEDKHFKDLHTKVFNLTPFVSSNSLNLGGCQDISDKGVEDITSICPNLKTFSICQNSWVTDFGIKSLVKNCKFITALNLSGCKTLTDSSLLTIGKASRKLEFLDITGCEQITDDGVMTIAKRLPSLQLMRQSVLLGAF